MFPTEEYSPFNKRILKLKLLCKRVPWSFCYSVWSALTGYHRLPAWLKQQKCIISQIWRLEGPNQNVNRAYSFWGLWAKNLLQALFLACRGLSFLCIPSHCFPCVCVCESKCPLFIRGSHIVLEPTLISLF